MKSIATVFLFVLWASLNGCSTNSKKQEDLLQDKLKKYQTSEELKIKEFTEDFRNFLHDPANDNFIETVYLEGLMNHISFSELPPSFVAFVELHRSLHNERDATFLKIEYGKKIAEFKKKFEKNNFFQKIDEFDNSLNELYSSFLIGLITQNLEELTKILNQNITAKDSFGLNIINRATFELIVNKKQNIQNKHKIQFEKLYVYHSKNNRNFVLSYNDRPNVCDRIVKIYEWNPEIKKIKIVASEKNEIDLSQEPRFGGCSDLVDFQNVIHQEGDVLKFSGYLYQQKKNYILNLSTGLLKVE